ncbi:diguanylate cyclase [Polaromonas sp.]|uniref:diguanylate cyclase domain-containing protein n=1 Tax=Polaromonas sp. TaxID=1869339 RepID=UPI0032660FF2
MNAAETMIWSAASGSIGLVVLLGVADALFSRSRASVQSLVYLTASWLFFTLLSGLPATLLPDGNASWLHTAQVLIGPLCAGLGTYGAGHWLAAPRRDRLTDISFRSASALSLAGGPLCLFLPIGSQLVASAVLTVLSLSVAVWLAVRATQQGDRLAWGLAAGCLLTLPMELGLYRIALNASRPSVLLQAGVALLGLLSIAVIAVVLWLRNHQDLQIRHDRRSRRDPTTQLYDSVAIVQKIIRGQRRLARTRRDGALMAVRVFEPEQLLNLVGQHGLNEIYSQLARRMQRHTGVVNPAGRYYDRCFVVLIESLHSPGWIRTMGLRVASSLRRPLEVVSLSGERIKVSADIAVGMVHLSGGGKDVDQLLHEAEDMAKAARGMRSRAALLDEFNRQAVPVENAELGSSWHAMRPARPHHPRPAHGVRQQRSPA